MARIRSLTRQAKGAKGPVQGWDALFWERLRNIAGVCCTDERIPEFCYRRQRDFEVGARVLLEWHPLAVGEDANESVLDRMDFFVGCDGASQGRPSPAGPELNLTKQSPALAVNLEPPIVALVSLLHAPNAPPSGVTGPHLA